MQAGTTGFLGAGSVVLPRYCRQGAKHVAASGISKVATLGVGQTEAGILEIPRLIAQPGVTHHLPYGYD